MSDTTTTKEVVQHMDGPWRGNYGTFTVDGIELVGVTVFDVEGSVVAYVDCSPVDDERRLANARLIEAAPDLLAACEEAIPFLIRLGDFIGNGEGPTRMERCDAITNIRNAVAEARGGA